MKKSIVLLISLFFISALSILIIKNLEDTNTFLAEKNHKLNRIQLLTTLKNIQVEISEIFKKNKDNINSIVDKLNSEYIPLAVEDILVSFTITKYTKIDINLLSSNDSKKYEEINNLFSSDFDSFRNIFNRMEKEYKSNEVFIKNNKQIDAIINIFINETYNDKASNLKDKLGFLGKNENETLYELFVKVNYIDDFAKAYYIINEEGVVKYFESSFK